MELILKSSYFLSTLSYLLLIIYIINNFKINHLSVLFLIKCVFLAIWSFAFFAVKFYIAESQLLFWAKIGSISWMFFVAFILHFVFTLVRKTAFVNKWYGLLTLYILPLILSFAVANDKLLMYEFANEIASKGIDYPLWVEAIYLAYVSLYVVLSILILFPWGLRSKEKEIRRHSYILLVTGLICYFFSSLTFIIATFYNNYNYAVINPFLLLIFMLGIWIALKHTKIIDVIDQITTDDFLNASFDGIIIINATNRIIKANNAFIKMMEATSVFDYQKKHISDVFSTLYRTNIFTELIEIGQIKEKAITIDLPNGTQKNILFSGKTFYNKQEEFNGYICFFKDITLLENVQMELKLHNENLELKVLERTKELDDINKKLFHEIIEKEKIQRKSEALSEKYRLLIETAQDAIYTVNLEGIVTSANYAMTERTGYSKEELIGDNFMNYMHPDEHEEAMSIHNMIQKGIKPPVFELRYLHKSGVYKYAEFSASPLLENGHIVGTLGIGRDVTDRKIAENNLKQSLEEKNILLKEIHHRVKNNMQVIISLLKLESFNTHNTQVLQIINSFVERLTSMKIVHEKLYQSENLKSINLHNYINDLIGHIKSSYLTDNNKNINIKLDIDNIDLSLDCLIPLGLLLNELITNSFKYAFPNKSGNITISFQRVNNHFELYVADNGIGMSDSQIDIDNTLGLRLVKSLVGQINGKMEINNKEGLEYKIHFSEINSN